MSTRFESSSNRLTSLNTFIEKIGTPMSTGLKFLDHLLGGIFVHELIVVGSTTGAGKTTFVTQIAKAALLGGKKVFYFSLESFTGGVEAYLKFDSLVNAFYTQYDWSKSFEPNFQDWLFAGGKGPLEKYGPEVDEIFKKQYANLYTFYRQSRFDIYDFCEELVNVQNEADLIIVDHLHYIDGSDRDENKSLKTTVKAIRDITNIMEKPVVLVSHVRKRDRRSPLIIPDYEDLHGSSDIAKIATRVITLAPAPRSSKAPGQEHIEPTYFRVSKNRYDGSRCPYIGIVGFDRIKNSYQDTYFLGRLSKDGSEVDLIKRENYPRWAKT